MALLIDILNGTDDLERCRFKLKRSTLALSRVRVSRVLTLTPSTLR